jgi:hypothetical protein
MNSVPNPLTVRVLSDAEGGRGLETFSSLELLCASWDRPHSADDPQGLHENTRNPP